MDVENNISRFERTAANGGNSLPTIAFTMYLSMLLGYGLTMVPFAGEEHANYWARYADWLFTTPLLLLDLALLVDAGFGTILGLVGADGIMIGTGLIGALTQVYEYRFIRWAVSTAAMLYTLYVLYFGFTRKANEMRDDVGSTFRVLRNLVLVLWSAFECHPAHGGAGNPALTRVGFLFR